MGVSAVNRCDPDNGGIATADSTVEDSFEDEFEGYRVIDDSLELDFIEAFQKHAISCSNPAKQISRKKYGYCFFEDWYCESCNFMYERCSSKSVTTPHEKTNILRSPGRKTTELNKCKRYFERKGAGGRAQHLVAAGSA